MQKNTPVLCALACLAFISWAQEYREAVGDDPGMKMEVTDAAARAIAETQAAPIDVPLEPPAKTAEQQLQKFIEGKKWELGWDAKGKRFFATGVYMFDSEDPSYDDSFISKREIAAKAATLKAKASIIEFVNTKMSAADRLTVPGSNVKAELREAFDKEQRKLEAQLKHLEALGTELKIAEAANLRGVAWGDRAKAMVDAIIKKLDKEYDAGKIETEKGKRYELAKTRYLEAQQEMARIEEEAKASQGQLSMNFESSIETMASMPLYGAICIAQAESWNAADEKYQVAMLFCWSPSLERAARAIASLEDNFVLVPPTTAKDETVVQWLRKQNLGTMVGSRQYIDGEGRRYILGVTARLLGKTSSQQEKARELADMNAKQMALFAVMGDLNSYKKAEQMLERRSTAGLEGKDIDTVAESFAQSISQEIKDQTVRGMARLHAVTVVHPIAQREIYVSVWGIAADAIKDCKYIEDLSYASKIQQIEGQKREQGRDMAIKDRLRDAEKNDEPVRQGYKEAATGLDAERLKRAGTEQRPAPEAKEKVATEPKESAGDKRKPQSGVFMSDKDIGDDF